MTAARRKPALEPEEKFSLRTLPHDLAAEKAILGAILINNRILDRILDQIDADDFFRRAHRAVFQAMLSLADRNEGIDLLTLKATLLASGELEEVGGPAYISAMTDGVPRTQNVEHYATIVRGHALRRKVITVGNQMLVDAYDGELPATDVVNAADLAIIELQRAGASGGLVPLSATTGELYLDLEYRAQHRGELSGIDTGFESLNQNTFGWQRGDLIVVGARPSIGKTAFVLNGGLAAAAKGAQVAFFSIEMARRQLEFRILAHLAGVQLTRTLGGFLGEPDFERITPAWDKMHHLPLHIDDSSRQTVRGIRSSCRQLKAEKGLDLVIIDYFQLMTSEVERRDINRTQELTAISRRLKIMAGELDVPILLLSQLSRKGKDRDDKEPQLEDLRDCGALEQDADIVFFLHRKDHRASGKTAGILKKQRNGPTGTIAFNFTRETQTFVDLGEGAAEQESLPVPEEDNGPKPPPGYGKRRKR